jgi:chromosome segregation ATPase
MQKIDVHALSLAMAFVIVQVAGAAAETAGFDRASVSVKAEIGRVAIAQAEQNECASAKEKANKADQLLKLCQARTKKLQADINTLDLALKSIKVSAETTQLIIKSLQQSVAKHQQTNKELTATLQTLRVAANKAIEAWKKRALEAEARQRKLIEQLNATSDNLMKTSHLLDSCVQKQKK